MRFKPITLPAVAVLSADAKLRRQLKEVKGNVVLPSSVRDLVGRILEEHHFTVPVSLYLNADNPTVQQLSTMATIHTSDSAIYESALRALYNNAILLTQQLITPDNAQAIYSSEPNYHFDN